MMRINLLPKERARRVLVTPRTIILAIFGVLVVALVIVAISLNVRNSRVRSDVEDLETEVSILKPQVAKVQDLEGRIVALRQKQEVLQRLDLARVPWESVLTEVSAVIPRDVWLTQLNAADDGTISLSGNALSYQAVARFMLSLDASPMFDGIDLGSTRKVKLANRDVAVFTITARRTVPGREASR